MHTERKSCHLSDSRRFWSDMKISKSSEKVWRVGHYSIRTRRMFLVDFPSVLKSTEHKNNQFPCFLVVNDDRRDVGTKRKELFKLDSAYHVPITLHHNGLERQFSYPKRLSNFRRIFLLLGYENWHSYQCDVMWLVLRIHGSKISFLPFVPTYNTCIQF